MKQRLLILVVAMAVLFVSTATFAAETIKIGALYTMTGRGGQYGKDSEVAIKMALDEENAKRTARGVRSWR